MFTGSIESQRQASFCGIIFAEQRAIAVILHQMLTVHSLMKDQG